MVTDPRHPLYGRRFPLLEAYDSIFRDAWCVIELEPGLRTQIPLAVTDRGVGDLGLLPLPLCLDSVQHLLVSFAAIMDQPAEGTDNEEKDDRAGASPPAGSDNVDRNAGCGLDKPDDPATGYGTQKAGTELPTTAATGGAA